MWRPVGSQINLDCFLAHVQKSLQSDRDFGWGGWNYGPLSLLVFEGTVEISLCLLLVRFFILQSEIKQKSWFIAYTNTHKVNIILGIFFTWSFFWCPDLLKCSFSIGNLGHNPAKWRTWEHTRFRRKCWDFHTNSHYEDSSTWKAVSGKLMVDMVQTSFWPWVVG